jgi:lipopolysaccharide exporter
MHLKAIRGVPWTVAAYGANKAVNVLTTVVLARLVAPADFGLIALAGLAIALLAFVKDMGLGGALVLRQDLSRRQLGTVLTTMTLVSVALAIAAAAISPLVADFFGEPRLAGVLAALSASLLISGFSTFYEVLLQREMEFRRRFVAISLQSATIAIVSIPVAALGGGVWSLVAGQVVALGVFAVAVFSLAPYRVRPTLIPSEVGSLFRTGSGFLLQNVALFARQNIDYIVVGRSFNAAAVGFYSMAYRLCDLTYLAIADPVARVTFPSFARTRSEGGDVRGSFLAVGRLVALVACPIGVLASAAAAPFTLFVFGERWAPMIGALQVLGLWAAIRPVDGTLTWFLNSIGHARVVGIYSLGVLVPLIPAFVLAANFGGTITWVSAVVIGDAVLSYAFLTVMVRRRGDVAIRDQWRSLRPAVLGCVPAWLAARGVVELTQSAPSGVALAASLAAGLAAYLGAATLVAPNVLKEAFNQVARTVGRGGEEEEAKLTVDPKPTIPTEVEF